MPRSFVLEFVLVVALTYIGAWFVADSALGRPLPFSFIWSFGLFALVTFFVFRLLTAANRKRPQIFVAYFMGTLAGKLFLSIAMLVIVGLTDLANFKFTALAYMVGYALLTVTEIRHLLPLVRKNDP